MRALLLTTLTMMAFASNSILNRMALAEGGMDAISFGAIRLASGAVMLAVLVLVTRGALRLGGPARVAGVGSLLLYIYGFSWAYLGLDAGLGALILFGVVQITMFTGGLMAGERPPAMRWSGAALAFAGLIWLLWPGAGFSVSVPHGLAMAVAGVGWGLYSLAGRKSDDPLMATTANFVIAAPICALVALGLVSDVDWAWSSIVLAIVCGAVTSGLGYALWYTVLPGLSASGAAVAQLTVPVIAMAGGMLFLGEVLTVDFVISAVLVLGGVALSVLAGKR